MNKPIYTPNSKHNKKFNARRTIIAAQNLDRTDQAVYYTFTVFQKEKERKVNLQLELKV
jgi:hypothetical protein